MQWTFVTVWTAQEASTTRRAPLATTLSSGPTTTSPWLSASLPSLSAWLNSAWPFLAYVVCESRPKEFLRRAHPFVRAAHERGISTMPVVWDSCFDEVHPVYDIRSEDWVRNPVTQRLGADSWHQGERYCHDLVDTLGRSRHWLWNVMNEPLVA